MPKRKKSRSEERRDVLEEQRSDLEGQQAAEARAADEAWNRHYQEKKYLDPPVREMPFHPDQMYDLWYPDPVFQIAAVRRLGPPANADDWDRYFETLIELLTADVQQVRWWAAIKLSRHVPQTSRLASYQASLVCILHEILAGREGSGNADSKDWLFLCAREALANLG